METCWRDSLFLILSVILNCSPAQGNPTTWNYIFGDHETNVHDDLTVLTFDDSRVRQNEDYFRHTSRRTERAIKEFPECKSIDEDAKKRVGKNMVSKHFQ